MMFSHELTSLKLCLWSVTKQAVTKRHLDGRYLVSHKYEIVRTAVSYQSVREMVLTSCGIPSRITCNKTTHRAYPWYYIESTLENKKREWKKEKHGEGTEIRKTIKKTETYKNETRSKHALRVQAESRGQG